MTPGLRVAYINQSNGWETKIKCALRDGAKVVPLDGNGSNLDPSNMIVLFPCDADKLSGWEDWVAQNAIEEAERKPVVSKPPRAQRKEFDGLGKKAYGLRAARNTWVAVGFGIGKDWHSAILLAKSYARNHDKSWPKCVV